MKVSMPVEVFRDMVRWAYGASRRPPLGANPSIYEGLHLWVGQDLPHFDDEWSLTTPEPGGLTVLATDRYRMAWSHTDTGTFDVAGDGYLPLSLPGVRAALKAWRPLAMIGDYVLVEQLGSHALLHLVKGDHTMATVKVVGAHPLTHIVPGAPWWSEQATERASTPVVFHARLLAELLKGSPEWNVSLAQFSTPDPWGTVGLAVEGSSTLTASAFLRGRERHS